MKLPLAFSVAVAVIALTGCALLGGGDPDAIGNVRRTNADHHVNLAAEEMTENRYRQALDRLVAVRKQAGLDPDLRARAELLLGECVAVLLDRYEGPEFDSDDLFDLYELQLPPRLRARAGILAADRLIAEKRRVAAFKQIRKVDRDLPTHPERALAGGVLARAGLSLIRDDRSYYLLFSYRARGVDALEYLVLRYPLDAHCPEAYSALAAHYEDAGDLDLAIERNEDLVIYHPTSPFTAAAEARSPYLRLKRLKRDDVDRKELETARGEVARWLARHDGHELEPFVLEVGRECERRLVSSDMILARYYDRIRSPFGARIHAERALRAAENAGLEEGAAAARTLLASLPAEDVTEWTVEVPEEVSLEAEEASP